MLWGIMLGNKGVKGILSWGKRVFKSMHFVIIICIYLPFRIFIYLKFQITLRMYLHSLTMVCMVYVWCVYVVTSFFWERALDKNQEKRLCSNPYSRIPSLFGLWNALWALVSLLVEYEWWSSISGCRELSRRLWMRKTNADHEAQKKHHVLSLIQLILA